MNIKKANQKLQKWIEARAKSDNLDLNDLTSAAGLALPYIFNGNLSLNGNLQTNHEIGPICFSSLFYLFSSRNRRSISEKIWISKELTAVVAEGDFLGFVGHINLHVVISNHAQLIERNYFACKVGLSPVDNFFQK